MVRNFNWSEGTSRWCGNGARGQAGGVKFEFCVR